MTISNEKLSYGRLHAVDFNLINKEAFLELRDEAGSYYLWFWKVTEKRKCSNFCLISGKGKISKLKIEILEPVLVQWKQKKSLKEGQDAKASFATSLCHAWARSTTSFISTALFSGTKLRTSHIPINLSIQHIFFLRLDPSPQILGDVSLLDHARFFQKAKRGGWII